MNVRLRIACLLALPAGFIMCGLSLAQERSAPSAGVQTTNGQPPLGGLPSNYDPSVSSSQETGTSGYSLSGDRGSSIRQAAEAVRDAQGSEAKADAQAKLTAYLVKSFDDDMDRREAELMQVEQRLAKLRELLDRRKDRKQEIIDLQAKVALNEADGLGFYEGERTNGSGMPGASNYGGELAPSPGDAAPRAF